MTVSVLFSIFTFQIASNEVERRIDRFQTNIQQSININPQPSKIMAFRNMEITKTSENLSIELLYINLIILLLGGFGSYFLAKRSLLPLQKAHEAQSRFTSDASHELRTPLAVMKAEIEVILRDNDPTTQDLREVLNSNLEEVDKLARLSEMLLNLSKLDHSKLKLKPININKVIRDVIKDFKQDSSRIVLTTKKQLTIMGNETAIIDLIRILIDNALQYSPNKSKVTIKVTKQDNQAKFEITNIGPGIKSNKISHIFNRFYRADPSRTNGNKKGYGLGLSLAKSIVELHNGELSVISIPDKKTTFTLLLPLNNKSQAKIKN